MKSLIKTRTGAIAVRLLLSVAAFGFGTATFAKPAKPGVEPRASSAGSLCTLSVTPLLHSSPGSGDTFPLSVTVSGAGCLYGVYQHPLWIDVTGVAGPTPQVIVGPNLGPPRVGTLTVKGLLHIGSSYIQTGQQFVVVVTQPTGSCTYSFDKTTVNVPGNTSLIDNVLNVTTASICPRNATSNASWLTILSGTNFSGSGEIRYSVAANIGGAARTGKITLGNATFTVTQGAACLYDFSPTSKDFDAAGGSAAINVTASNSACPRNATSNAGWITITGGNNSNGSGPVTYSVAANKGPARFGEIKLTGALPFTVVQAGGCNYTLSSSIFNFQPGKGVSSIQVTASSSLCPWSAQSNAPWVKITSGAQVTGSGTVAFTVDANSGAARTATITIGNKTATINQFGNQPIVDCSFTINPGNYHFGVVGGEVIVNVTASKDSCKWNMGNMSPFISVVNGGLGGTGNGTVKLKIQANAGTARSGSAEIAGKTFAVTQDGVNAQAMVIIDLSPGFTAAGGTEFFLTVKGSNFASTCRVQWNGQERPTTFFNNSTLMATISANDIVGEGIFDVTVANNSNGAESNSENFLVYGAMANVSSASFKGESLAPASLVSAFGGDLSKELKIANSQPLPTELAGTTVTVTDAIGKEHDAQLFFVSSGQVNYLMPSGVALGKATVMINSGSGHTSVGTVEIAPVAPGLFSANSTGVGLASALAVRVKANGQQVYEQTVQYDPGAGVFTAKPIDVSVPGEQVYLILWGTGLRYRNSLGSVSLSLGGVSSNALYAGEAPGYPGLDQINVLAPISLAGRGAVDVTLTVDGKKANTVKLTFK